MDNQSTQQPLVNDLVELKIQHQPHCVVEFSVKASASLVKNAHKQAIKAVAKETTLPGFRKGKAPDAMIQKHFAAAIDKKWQQQIAEEAFRESEKLAQTPVLNSDSRIGFTMVKHSLEEGAEMKFHFETEPQTPSVDPKALTLQKEPAPEVDRAKVDETLHRIRLFFAKWQPVVDRGVQEGDFLIVDLDALEENGPTRVFTDTRLEVKAETMALWMRDIVIGMRSGESKEGISAPDESASEADRKHFKPKKVLVKVKAIEEPVLPPVDDAFASKVGAESAEIMLQRLHTLLKKQAEEAQQIKYRDALTHLLLQNYQFDVPESLLTKEVQHRVQNLVKTPGFNRKTEEEKQQEVLHIKKQAEEALRLFYLCKKIAIDHRLNVSPSDLNQEIHSPLDAMFADRELANPHKTEEQKNLLMSRILLEKAQDFIIDQILG